MVTNKLKVLLKDELMDKVCVVVGTRPGIIKMSPIIRELAKRGNNYFIIHTGQHYSYNMDKKFFIDLELDRPKYTIDNTRKHRLHGEQTAKMIMGIEKALMIEKPRIILVGGDANTNLAGALAARKLHIKVGHVEAGLRSNDWIMPEEHNRIIIDHISDFLFAPTRKAKDNLIQDNVKGKIVITGNTIVDAIYQNLNVAKRKSRILNMLNLKKNVYFLLSIHREENVDFRENIQDILEGLELVSNRYKSEIIFPIHPRTRKRLKEFNLKKILKKIKLLRVIAPIGYLDFLLLLNNARLVMTDSGGIQEEACILEIPCVTLRKNTERPESVEVGANIVAGVDSKNMLISVKKMLNSKRVWKNPFGDGIASRIICDTIIKDEEIQNNNF